MIKKLFFIFILFLLISCNLDSSKQEPAEETDKFIFMWDSFNKTDDGLTLSWLIPDTQTDNYFLLYKNTTESDWLPENGVKYSTDSSAGIIYSGKEDSFTDTEITVGQEYIYSLFSADSNLNYTDPLIVKIKIEENSDNVITIGVPRLIIISGEEYYINVEWQDSDYETAGYLVVKSTTPIDWAPTDGEIYTINNSIKNCKIVQVGENGSYKDLEIEDDLTYYYKIFAYNNDKVYSIGLECQILYKSESQLDYNRFPWIDNYMIYYGALDNEAIETAKEYDLVIIHPTNNSITRDQVRQIQRGKKLSDPSDDVLVIAYVAVGEDLRTTKFYPSDATEPDYAAMLQDKRFTRNGIGPRVDPRGPTPDGAELEYDYSIGNPSPGGSGFASYYLDDNDVVNGIIDGTEGSGKPDFNVSWRGAFVNAGDPLWFQEVDKMLFETDGIYGLQEILTTEVGMGLGADGIFMDAMDTFAPNSWTDEGSYVQNEFEWTAPGFSDFIQRLKEKYPNKAVVQNRAVFMFKPGRTQKYLKYSSRKYIDFLLFESFRLNSNSTEDYNSAYYYDNLYNYAPAILVEANREDGFQILSLGYSEGVNVTSSDLQGGYNQMLVDDISITHNIGFRHFLSNKLVNSINTYVKDNADFSDTTPPTWSSVYNEDKLSAPVPRYGLLKAEAIGNGKIRVFWDVATDKYSVDYYLYYSKTEFDFDNNPGLNGINRVKLSPKTPDDYINNFSSTTYPNYDDISGLNSGEFYHLCIRAVDNSENRNMDTNISTLFLTVLE